MNRALLWPAALLALAAFAAPALAQYIPTGQPLTPPAGQPSGIGFVQEVKTADAPAADMQEEIEIMRRLLDGAFAEAYGFSVHLPPTSPIRNYPMIGPAQLSDDGRLTFAHHVDATATHTEGVYLKDYGVVYTVTLPLPPFSVLPGPSSGGGPRPRRTPGTASARRSTERRRPRRARPSLATRRCPRRFLRCWPTTANTSALWRTASGLAWPSPSAARRIARVAMKSRGTRGSLVCRLTISTGNRLPRGEILHPGRSPLQRSRRPRRRQRGKPTSATPSCWATCT